MTDEERSALREVFWRHRGSLGKLAKELGITTPQLNLWFRRKVVRVDVAPKIEEAVKRRAQELEAFEG